MNEVKKCSLSGFAFTMDIEAYNELNNYITTLKKRYKDQSEGGEIVADIEARIAELILSTQHTDRVVELPLIKNIIAQMGSADEIADAEQSEPTHTSSERNPRRLYRDTENSKLGGVCAGIGKYFEIDPVWVRVVIFLPLLLSCFAWIPFLSWFAPMMGNLFGVFIICYLVMWFAIPVARTARQKLEMNGERITADSISRQTMSKDPDSTAKAVVADTVSTFGKVVLILLKLLAGLIVFGLVMVVMGLIIGLFAIVIGSHEIIPVDIALAVPVLGIFVAMIPSVMLIYALMCLIASRKPNGKAILVMFLLWILTTIGLGTTAICNHYEIFTAADAISDKLEQIDETLDKAEDILDSDGALQISTDGSLNEAVKALQSMEGIKITVDESAGDQTKMLIEAQGKKLFEIEVKE
ncbi:MAG: PspC domain-containing protein [Alistipes sp.]|nr:PspC domain-containing protein [Alistipes sp.]